MLRLTELRRGRGRDERGAVVLMVAVMTTALFGVAALVVDLGAARVLRAEAQAASDASALAAGNALYLSGRRTPDVPAAIAAAKTFAEKNYGVAASEWTACVDAAALDHPAADTDCISFDDDTEPTAVRVKVPMRTATFVFAPLLGAESVDVDAHAQASVRVGGVSDCGLCIVGSGYHDLQNGDAYISGGNVAINGDVNIQNNGLVSTDGIISVEGYASGPLDGYDPDPLTGQEPIEDPLADYPLPEAPFTGLSVRTNPCAADSTGGPGIYGSYNFPTGVTCVLQPGLYVITGEWDFSGTSALDAMAGVTLYFTCGSPSNPGRCNPPGQSGGWLDAGGNGNIRITAPTSGPTQGLAIAYDRLNIRDLELSGMGSSYYSGTIYAIASTMRYDGNGCSTVNQSLIVVDSLEFNGSPACLNSSYNLNTNVYVPADGLHLSR